MDVILSKNEKMIKFSKVDFDLLADLNSREYNGNSMSTNSTEKEQQDFRIIKRRLKSLAEFFKKEFDDEFGIFTPSASSGNPIKFRGTKLNRVWSGIYKGSSNKQYAAQISFVVNQHEHALDIGFYFGRASSRGKSADFDKLLILGKILSDTVKGNKMIKQKYEELIDFGFKPTTDQGEVTSSEWLDIIKSRPQNCQLTYKLKVNENDIIDLTTISLYVKMLMFLMSIIPSEESQNSSLRSPSLTPEQRAKQAERLALIGLQGEQFIVEHEKDKLLQLGINDKKYLVHKSLESDSYGYDILSCDSDKNEMFIEVKTTTRKRNDSFANRFFISGSEYEFFKTNIEKYKLYRVYDIDGTPEFEEIDLINAKLQTDSYKVEYEM